MIIIIFDTDFNISLLDIWLLLCAKVQLALARDLLGLLLDVAPHSLLFLKLLE